MFCITFLWMFSKILKTQWFWTILMKRYKNIRILFQLFLWKCMILLPRQPRCCQTLPDAPRCSLPDAPTWFQVLPDAPRCCQMLPDAPSCCQMLPDAARCSQMLPDAPRCSQMFPDAPRCSQMSPDASRSRCPQRDSGPKINLKIEGIIKRMIPEKTLNIVFKVLVLVLC